MTSDFFDLCLDWARQFDALLFFAVRSDGLYQPLYLPRRLFRVH